MSSFDVGDSVSVKEDTEHPGDISVDIAGWQGRIQEKSETEDGKTLLTIAWDSRTLEQMPHDYIADSERDGLSWHNLRLHADDVRFAQPRDTEKQVKRKKKELWEQYRWYGFGEQGERILEVLDEVELSDRRACLERWKGYLDEYLDYPVGARICDDVRISSEVRGDEVSILGITFLDDAMGLIVDVQSPNNYSEIPLINLCVDQSSNLDRLLDDYKTWQTHR